MEGGNSTNGDRILKTMKQGVFPGLEANEAPLDLAATEPPPSAPIRAKNELDAVAGSEIHIAQLVLGDLHKQHNHAMAEKKAAESEAKFWTERIERLKTTIQDKTNDVNELMAAQGIVDGSSLVRKADGSYVIQAPRTRR